MIDPLTSLSISIYDNKGVYALLLGSGISRDAGIPTGEEIVLDLIRKLALIEKEDCESNPNNWYFNKFDEKPDYSKLLSQLTHSPVERNQLLKGYFEPNDEELENGLKIPTDAHKAIADLVKGGYIRVIITTNFDRLLEKALESINITPTVISTSDSAEGAIPLQHTQCTIIKVNGDYLDIRFKNTPDELAEYDEPINNLLDRIFDEFGLIVCGWSGKWDLALYKTIEHCKNHRFATYWTIRGEANEKLDKLIIQRKGKKIPIQNADTFFFKIAENVMALDKFNRPHPLSAKLAGTSLKKYLVGDKHRIYLHDFVMQEVEKLYKELSDDNFSVKVSEISFSPEELNHRLQHYESLTEIVLSIMINGCYWDDKSQENIWIKCLERIANPVGEINGFYVWINLRLYPALLLLYGGGIASIAAKNYSTFSDLLTKVTVGKADENRGSPVSRLFPWSVINDEEIAKHIMGTEKSNYPLSDHLFQVLREPLKEFLPHNIDYRDCFERFEYLFGLIHADLKEEYLRDKWWGPVGIFGEWNYFTGIDIMLEVEEEISEKGEDWPLLNFNHFDGSIERLKEVKNGFDEYILSLVRH